MFKCFSNEDEEFDSENKASSFVLIKDTLRKSGRPLLKGIAAHTVNDVSSLECISYELPVELFSEGLDYDMSFHDAFSDPFGWKKQDSEQNYFSPGFLSDIDPFLPVVIDSLSAYLVHNTVQTLYRSIHDRRKEGMVVGLLHTDSHPPEDCALIDSLATTVIDVIPDSPPNVDLCRITFRAYAKKPRVVLCSYTMGSEALYDKLKFRKYKTSVSNDSAIQNKRKDPAANLTFNLNLTESEKKSRSEVPLPYAKIPDEDDESNEIKSYDDLEDDIDEEDDPDDDLNF